MLQAYDSIATADFNLTVPEHEVSSEQFLFHTDVKPEKDEVVVVENHEIKETEIEKYSDMDDKKTSAAVLTVVISHEQNNSSDEIEEIDGNKRKENSDMDTSSVTVVDMRNENADADAFHLNSTTTNNKESGFEPVISEETIDNEMHVIESVQNVHVTRIDITKEQGKVKETNIHVGELKEEGMMEEATDNSVRTIRMFRNARETLVSTSFFF